MRSAAALLLFLSSIASANPESFSVSGGLSAINSDIGYSLGVITPYGNATAVSLTFSEYLTTRNNSFGFLTVEAVNRVYSTERFAAYFKSGGFWSLWQEGKEFTMGIKFSVGTEFFLSQSLSLYSDLGWSLPMKKSDPVIAQGAAITIGIKLYL